MLFCERASDERDCVRRLRNEVDCKVLRILPRSRGWAKEVGEGSSFFLAPRIEGQWPITTKNHSVRTARIAPGIISR